MKSRREEYAEQTRNALIEEACFLFAEKGYNKTSIDEVAKNARVTKGALYHHFEKKEVLFAAAYQKQVEELKGFILVALKDISDPWARVVAGCDAFMEFGINSKQKRISLQDAISTLGWNAWRQLDSNFTMGLIEEMVSDLIKRQEIKSYSASIAADLIYSLLVEAAMTVSRAKGKKKVREETLSIIIDMMKGLRS